MADSDLTFTGLSYLNGARVSCAIGGLDCGDFTVASGQIVVPLSSNVNLTRGYIGAVAARVSSTLPNLCALTLGGITYLVPVVIGRAYTSKGQGLRALLQEEIKSPSGGGLGKTRRGHQFSLLFIQSGPCNVGTDFTTMYATRFKQGDNFTDWPGTSGYSGVYHDVLADAGGFDTLLSWECARPVPCTIAAAAVHEEVQER